VREYSPRSELSIPKSHFVMVSARLGVLMLFMFMLYMGCVCIAWACHVGFILLFHVDYYNLLVLVYALLLFFVILVGSYGYSYFASF